MSLWVRGKRPIRNETAYESSERPDEVGPGRIFHNKSGMIVTMRREIKKSESLDKSEAMIQFLCPEKITGLKERDFCNWED